MSDANESRDPDDDPTHNLWKVVARAYHHLGEAIPCLQSAQKLALAAGCGADTRQKLKDAFEHVYFFATQLRPMVDEDTLERMHKEFSKDSPPLSAFDVVVDDESDDESDERR